MFSFLGPTKMRCFSKRQPGKRKVWGAAVLGSSCGAVVAIPQSKYTPGRKLNCCILPLISET